MKPLFVYHMRYRLAYIEEMTGHKATRDRDGISGIPGKVSISDNDGNQYDFFGGDDNNLVLLWINDERLNEQGRAVDADRYETALISILNLYNGTEAGDIARQALEG